MNLTNEEIDLIAKILIHYHDNDMASFKILLKLAKNSPGEKSELYKIEADHDAAHIEFHRIADRLLGKLLQQKQENNRDENLKSNLKIDELPGDN